MEEDMQRLINLNNRVNSMMKDPKYKNDIRRRAKIKEIQDEIMNEELLKRIDIAEQKLKDIEAE